MPTPAARPAFLAPVLPTLTTLGTRCGIAQQCGSAIQGASRFAARSNGRVTAVLETNNGGDSDGVPSVRAPQDVATVVAAAAAALHSALDVKEGTGDVLRGRASILVPGLNQQIENTAPFNEGLLFAIGRELAVQSTAVKPKQRCAGLLFSSAGGAASAASAFAKDPATNLPDNVFVSVAISGDVHRDLTRWRDVNDDQSSHAILVIIGAKNSRGDSVILDIEEILKALPSVSVVLLNPDLDNTADNNAIGIREIQRRREVLDSFQEVYYFRPLFSVKRPSLIPIERGLLIREGIEGLWNVLVCTSTPGAYTVAAQFETLPSRQDIAAAVEESKFMQRQAATSAGEANQTPFLYTLAALSLFVLLLSVAFSGRPMF